MRPHTGDTLLYRRRFIQGIGGGIQTNWRFVLHGTQKLVESLHVGITASKNLWTFESLTKYFSRATFLHILLCHGIVKIRSHIQQCQYSDPLGVFRVTSEPSIVILCIARTIGRGGTSIGTIATSSGGTLVL